MVNIQNSANTAYIHSTNSNICGKQQLLTTTMDL